MAKAGFVWSPYSIVQGQLSDGASLRIYPTVKSCMAVLEAGPGKCSNTGYFNKKTLLFHLEPNRMAGLCKHSHQCYKVILDYGQFLLSP